MSGFNDNNQQKNMNNMKRNLTLDFNQAKKSMNLGSVLSSPDLNMLKVGTPELEKIILGSGISTSTPTPSAANPNTMIFPPSVTEEQEKFATGFVDALQNLHNCNSQTSDSNSTVYTDLEQPNMNTFLPVIKEEPQTVPNINNSPPVSPVDMEFQERMKLERKRQRNRLAASKCRSRKLERISKLEEKVKLLKGENTDLGTMINQLRDHVNTLKMEVLEHVHSGCQIMM